MSKVLVQLVLGTVSAEGENHRLNSVIEVEKENGADPASNILTGINAIMQDESKTLSFPAGKGHVSVRGSEISWAYVENVEEDEQVSNEIDLADLAGAPESVKDVLPIPKKKKNKR